MNLSSGKKILILGIILIVLAGIIVVALRGMNVDLMMKAHKSVDILIGTRFDLNDVDEICKEVFGDKKYVLRKVEIFEDSVNISVASITDEEKSNLVEKMNEKFGLELNADETEVISVAKIRIRDVVKPYIKPVIIVGILIEIYIAIRFRKLNVIKVILNSIGLVAISEAVLVSLIAICRIPLSMTLLSLLFTISVIEIIIYITRCEKKLVS